MTARMVPMRPVAATALGYQGMRLWLASFDEAGETTRLVMAGFLQALAPAHFKVFWRAFDKVTNGEFVVFRLEGQGAEGLVLGVYTRPTDEWMAKASEGAYVVGSV